MNLIEWLARPFVIFSEMIVIGKYARKMGYDYKTVADAIDYRTWDIVAGVYTERRKIHGELKQKITEALRTNLLG